MSLEPHIKISFDEQKLPTPDTHVQQQETMQGTLKWPFSAISGAFKVVTPSRPTSVPAATKLSDQVCLWIDGAGHRAICFYDFTTPSAGWYCIALTS